MGWAALGGFETILVDNGGPYRSRLKTMMTVLLGGAVACVVGSMVAGTFWVAVLVTAAFCFVATFARVVAQPVASFTFWSRSQASTTTASPPTETREPA